MKNTATDRLGWALWYAARGWPVFPCLPGAKEPATGHGVLDATTDPAVITAWWRRWPDANIGIATGAPGPDVLDVDTHPGEDGWASWNRCKRAGLLAGCFRLVSTRSGGLHAYFAGTDRGCGRLRAEGLDYQARGGYVIAPPSYVLADEKGPAGAYVLIEDRPPTGAALPWDAVKRLLRPPRERPLRSTRRRTWTSDALPPSITDALAADDPEDRSAAMFGLVGTCVRAGLDDERIYNVVGGYPPAAEKYGARLDAEIGRAIAKIAGGRDE